MYDPELKILLQELAAHQSNNLELPFNPEDTQILEGAKYVFDNSIDVSLNSQAISATARMICEQTKTHNFSLSQWSIHELHPKAKDESTVDFIFTLDLLNFSFWSEKSEDERFSVLYKGKKWKGYWSLVAALQRALDEEIPITSPEFWRNEEACTEEILKHVFRSATIEEIPLFKERVSFLREAADILFEKFDGSFVGCIRKANKSAVTLVNLIATEFSCFNDVVRFEDKDFVKFLKRAQICVADIWAAFDGDQYGSFFDIDKITIFADYRIPQILNDLGCISYSPPLENAIRKKISIQSGHSWEVQIRGCSIWCVELIRREILKIRPDLKIFSIQIDFYLWNLVEKWEVTGRDLRMPHHRTRSVWY